MKDTSIFIFSLFLLCMLPFTSDATNDSLKIPLVEGKNPTVEFETLIIEPVNLYIQPEPQDEHALHTQLELNVTDRDRTYSTFLQYYKINEDHKINNFPNAFGKYLFSLKIGNDNQVELAVEKTDFRKEFFLNLEQSVSIENLTICFESSIVGWSVDPTDIDTMINDYCSYHLSLKEGKEKQSFEFESLDIRENEPLRLEWKNYVIEVFYVNSEYCLKLKIKKNSSS